VRNLHGSFMAMTFQMDPRFGHNACPYKPAKCQNIPELADVTDLLLVACVELTVSSGCQNWVGSPIVLPLSGGQRGKRLKPGFQILGTHNKNKCLSLFQWLKLSTISRPTLFFVMIDEHPDSINDGFFLNNPSIIAGQWGDDPAAYHQWGGRIVVCRRTRRNA